MYPTEYMDYDYEDDLYEDDLYEDDLGGTYADGWEYFYNETNLSPVEFQRGDRGDVTGKYLFFSTSRDELSKLAKYEIDNHNFQIAKVAITKAGTDYVMCLYWKDDSRKLELEVRHGWNCKVKYRYWKSNQDTLDGKYSQQHLKNITRT